MRDRQPLPSLWLLTDERQGEALWHALAKLRPGSGVIVRHYGSQADVRRAFFDHVHRLAKKRRLTLLLAGDAGLAKAWKADGFYGGKGNHRVNLMYAATAHTGLEIRQAERAGADIVFLSPLFATRSHPNAHPLGRARFAKLARETYLPVIALGGVKSHHRYLLRQIGAFGWAAIDAHIGI